MIFIRWIVSITISFIAGSAVAETTAYQGATLIDGTLGGVVENATVLVEDDKFVSVGADVVVPENAAVVDVSGKWIVPGLIDSHVHFMTSGRMYTRPAFFDLTDKVPYEEEIAFIKAHIPDTLRANMCSGVTGVVSMGGPSLEYNTRALAEEIDAAPTVFIGHGVIAPMPQFIAERMIPPWDGELTLKPGMSEEAGIAHVREAVSKGADLIKTALDSRGSVMVRSMLWYADWQEFQQAVVAEAKRNGLQVTTHAHELEYARGAVEAGAATLQHVVADQPVDQPFVDLLLENDVVVVPTLAIRKRTFIELFTKELELLPIERLCSVPGVVDSWNEPVPAADAQSTRYRVQGEIAAANVKTLYDARVPLAVATDSGMIGIPAGSGMHLELVVQPERDLVVADGQTIKMGSARVRFIVTPGHTPGTLSSIITVKHNGRDRKIGMWGGQALPVNPGELAQMHESLHKFWNQARAEGVEGLISTHAWVVGNFELRERSRGVGENPLLIGQDGVDRIMHVYDECIAAQFARMRTVR